MLGRSAPGQREGGEREELGAEEERETDDEDDVMVVVEGENGAGVEGTRGPETQLWDL